MFEDRRLTECYKKALAKGDVLSVDENSRFVFFSDVHRGDNSMADEFAHNQNVYSYALKSYFDEGFTYLELGDGDELWEYSGFQHIRSAHSDVFCQLKEYFEDDRLYYFYGNHNMVFRKKNKVEQFLSTYYDDYTDKVEPLFPSIDVKESMVLKDSITGKEILVVHGHQGDFTNDQAWIISLVLMKVFWRYMHKIGFQNPASPSKSRVKRHKIEKAFTRWINQNKIGILCGHTHRPKLPDVGDAVYLNTGCCVQPRGLTAIELVGRDFYLVHWNIKAVKNGHLAIKKKIMKGPLSFDQMNLK